MPGPGITDLQVHQAIPHQLAAWIGSHRSRTASTRVCDVTYDEDHTQIRTGAGPHAMAALRNAAIGAIRTAGITRPPVIATLRNSAIGYHRITGPTIIARAIRHANRRPHELITAVTSRYPVTQ